MPAGSLTTLHCVRRPYEALSTTRDTRPRRQDILTKHNHGATRQLSFPNPVQLYEPPSSSPRGYKRQCTDTYISKPPSTLQPWALLHHQHGWLAFSFDSVDRTGPSFKRHCWKTKDRMPVVKGLKPTTSIPFTR